MTITMSWPWVYSRHTFYYRMVHVLYSVTHSVIWWYMCCIQSHILLYDSTCAVFSHTFYYMMVRALYSVTHSVIWRYMCCIPYDCYRICISAEWPFKRYSCYFSTKSFHSHKVTENSNMSVFYMTWGKARSEWHQCHSRLCLLSRLGDKPTWTDALISVTPGTARWSCKRHGNSPAWGY